MGITGVIIVYYHTVDSGQCQKNWSKQSVGADWKLRVGDPQVNV